MIFGFRLRWQEGGEAHEPSLTVLCREGYDRYANAVVFTTEYLELVDWTSRVIRED